MRKVIICLWVLMTAVACFAQAERERADKPSPPGLSGTWVLDKSKSPKVEADEFTLVIVHREPEIRITEKLLENGRELVNESIHYTDGRSDSDSAEGDRYQKVKIRWKGDTLIRETIYTTGGTRFEMVSTEEWKLSKDNKTLTRTIVSRQRISMNETLIPRLVRKYVFKRIS
jgi:hypothetical protein